MEPYLKVRNLRRSYYLTPGQRLETGRKVVRAVQGLSFNVHKGECFGLIGPVGSGKTTAMKSIAHRIFFHGRIYLEGKKVTPGYRPSVEMISAEWDLTEFYSSQIGFDLAVRARGLDARDMVERRDRIFRRFGLEDVQMEFVRDLPPDKRRRLSLVLGMTRDTDIVIYDEPEEPLDEETYALLVDYLQELKAKGVTLIMAAQWDVRLIEKMCDRVGIMFDGKMRACGELHKLCRGGTLRNRYCEAYADYEQARISKYGFLIS